MPLLARKPPRPRAFKLRVWWARLAPDGETAMLEPKRGCALQEWRNGEVTAALNEHKPLIANLGDRLFLAHPDIDISETCAADVVWTDGERYRVRLAIDAWPTSEWVRVMPMRKVKAA